MRAFARPALLAGAASLIALCACQSLGAALGQGFASTCSPEGWRACHRRPPDEVKSAILTAMDEAGCTITDSSSHSVRATTPPPLCNEISVDFFDAIRGEEPVVRINISGRAWEGWDIHRLLTRIVQRLEGK